MQWMGISNMNRINVRSLVSSLLAQLESAKRRRKEVDEEMAEITSVLQGLSRPGDDPRVVMDLLAKVDERVAREMIALVRPVLFAHKSGMTAPQIKVWLLMNLGIDFSRYFDAATPRALRSMKESGEVREFTNKQGEKAYRMKKPPQRSAGRVNARKTPKSRSVATSSRRRSTSGSGYRRLVGPSKYRRPSLRY